MANYCYYTMMATGEEENIDTLIKMLKWEGMFKDNGLGRIYEVCEMNRKEIADGLVSVTLTGDCAWSVLTAMRDVDNIKLFRSIEDASRQLDLIIEIFSEESGFGFQEHLLIVKGEVIVDDSVDYEEHYVEEFDTIEQYNEEFETDFTEDMIVDGYIYIGGYGDDYCNFSNHLEYIN